MECWRLKSEGRGERPRRMIDEILTDMLRNCRVAIGRFFFSRTERSFDRGFSRRTVQRVYCAQLKQLFISAYGEREKKSPKLQGG